MELDGSTCLVVEVSNSQALRGIQNESHVGWVIMVAPGMTMVVSNPVVKTKTLETLALLITVLYAYNNGVG